MKTSRIKYIIYIFSLSLVVSACSSINKNEFNNNDFWYGCSSFCISSVEGYSQKVYSNFYYDDFYYLTVYGEKLDENIKGPYNFYFLYKIDSNGNGISKVSLPVKCSNSRYQIIANDKLICFDSTEEIEYVININNGDIISEERTNEEIQGFYSLDDEYFKLMTNKLIRYSKDGNETGQIDIHKISNVSSIYYINDKYYLLGSDCGRMFIYEMDFYNNKFVKIMENKVSIDYEYELIGDIIFTNAGIYRIDPNNLSLVPVTKWNYVDVKPAYKATNAEINVSYGYGRFGKVYEYTDYELELIIFNIIPASVYSNRETITIGGYGVESSLAIKWAVYEFNTSQNEYRVYLEDYWNEYQYSSGVEAQSQIVKLIKHFNEGNAPDIYYGTNFDYRYMYNAGMVTDMLPIIERDPDFSLEALVPSIKDTITKNSVCYQIFPAFSFDGDFGLRSVFGDDNITIFQIDKMAQETGISVRGDMPASEFADQIIRYSLGEFIDSSSENHVISVEELKNVVDYSVSYGMPYGTYSDSIADMKGVHDGAYLTCRRTYLGNLYALSKIECKLDDSFVYLGFPSIYGSAHAAQPDGLVSISADTKHQDACWHFIKYMLSDEVQEIEIGRGKNPVMNNALNDFCKYASDPKSVPETEIIWNSIVSKDEAISEWIISDYLSMVYSVDSVISYDWGLYNIISDEINSYYLQNRSVDAIAETLQSRLDLYVSENYK